MKKLLSTARNLLRGQHPIEPPLETLPVVTPVAQEPVTYQDRLKAETANFAAQVNVHELPEIFHYWSNRYLRPIAESFGFSNPDQFFALYIERAMSASDGRTVRVASIGSGNCDTEVRVAAALRQNGRENFVIECLDVNEAMLERGGALAREANVQAQVVPVRVDFNAWQPAQQYQVILANQSLHHVVELERLFDTIRAALAPGAAFVASDMIGRNGHQRWPEALAIVREFWRELPPAYRYNVQLQRQEDEFMDWDCSVASFEGIRAQDILPLLVERFEFELFLGFANVIDPFIDRSFGHHFDAQAEWDRGFIDRVHARDEAEILSGSVKPTHMMAVMRNEPVAQPRFWRHLTPRFCLRPVA